MEGVSLSEAFLNGKVTLHCGDNRDVLKGFADNSIDSVVTDPPYALVSISKRFGKDGAAPVVVPEGGSGAYARASRGFMGKTWDTGETAFAVEFWAEVFRVLKPGGHVVAFSGTRTYHRMAVAIEDAGFEIRDMCQYLYGSGFPKSHNVSRNLNDVRCCCEGQSSSNSVLQRDLRPVPQPDVSTAKHTEVERGEVLLTGLSKQSASGTVPRGKSSQGEQGAKEQRMEGRSDLSQSPRELRECEIRALPTGPYFNGAEGRLHNGTSLGHGCVGGEALDADGMRSSHRPQPVEQFADQFGTVAVQQKPQDGGVWEDCHRCGKPIILDGLGTALKPAVEPICLARKPLIGTVAENVLEHGTGALNVDGCRVGKSGATARLGDSPATTNAGWNTGHKIEALNLGRWPANVIHDGSDEVVAGFPHTGFSSGGSGAASIASANQTFSNKGKNASGGANFGGLGDSGSAARFFYTAKADATDRAGSKHPTVKPVDLMQWLCRLITPPGGTVLDPFAGSGSTGEAAWREGFNCILIERESEYQDDIRRRLRMADQGPVAREHSRLVALGKVEAPDTMPLFGGGGSLMDLTSGRRIYGHFADQNERLARLDSKDDI